MHGGQVINTGEGLLFVFMVLSRINNTSIKVCTGSAIGPSEVITAAHCVVDTVSSPDNTVINPGRFRASKIIIHPNYVDRVANDLAIIKVNGILAKWVEITEEEVLENDYCHIAGYGDNGSGDTGHLGILKITLLSQPLCDFVTGRSDLVCSAQANGVEPCEGDSGGPLMCNGVLAGVISRGISSPPVQKCGKHSLVIVQYENVQMHSGFIRKAVSDSSASDLRWGGSSMGKLLFIIWLLLAFVVPF